MSIEVKVPDLGGSTQVPVIEVLVRDGDAIAPEAVLLVLESDKATMEVPAPAGGTVQGLRVKVGDKLSPGDVICVLGSAEVRETEVRETGDVSGETSTAPSSAPPTIAPQPTAVQPSPQPTSHPSLPTPAAAAPTASPPSASAGSTLVRVPDLGSFTQVPVIEVLIAEGQRVEKDAAMLVLESDKSTMEVPAPASGVVRNLAVAVGSKLSPGDVICALVTESREGASPAPDHPVAPVNSDHAIRGEAAPTDLAPARSSVAGYSPGEVAIQGNFAESGSSHAGPATRKFARELGVDLSQVTGSGAHGRVTVEDVQAFVKGRMQSAAAPQASAAATGTAHSGIPPIPAQDFAQFGAIERKELARIRKLSAAHLSRAWLNVPHVTQQELADITELEAFRKRINEEGTLKLTLLPLVMKAVAAALKAYPEFNSSLAPEGDAIILKQYCHLGFAADTPNGLVVPVVRDVWAKSVSELASETASLAKKARDGKLGPNDLRGGCFSISSLGGLGVGGFFTPIVNAPEVGILGVSKASLQPVWTGKDFAPRLMLPLSLSYDHRVIDGAYAARFIVHLRELLADIRRLVL